MKKTAPSCDATQRHALCTCVHQRFQVHSRLHSMHLPLMKSVQFGLAAWGSANTAPIHHRRGRGRGRGKETHSHHDSQPFLPLPLYTTHTQNTHTLLSCHTHERTHMYAGTHTNHKPAANTEADGHIPYTRARPHFKFYHFYPPFKGYLPVF